MRAIDTNVSQLLLKYMYRTTRTMPTCSELYALAQPCSHGDFICDSIKYVYASPATGSFQQDYVHWYWLGKSWRRWGGVGRPGGVGMPG